MLFCIVIRGRKDRKAPTPHSHFSILPSYFQMISFCYFVALETVFSIPVHSSPCRLQRLSPPLGCNHSNLVYLACAIHVQFLVSGRFWNCRSAVKNGKLISAYGTLQSVDFSALTETWITPENTATPAALSSSDYVFSHSLTESGRCGGGTRLLIHPK